MSFRTLAIGFVFLSLGGVASATPQASKQRLDEIWEAVDNRISQQIDIWFDDGDYPKSIHMLVFEAEYSPHNYDVITNLGWMQENVEEWDAALATYQQYRRNNPQDRDRALAEANYLFRRKKYDTIPALLEPLLKEKPHPNNFRILAHTYERQKKFADAKRVWMALVALDPQDKTAALNLKRVEKKLNPSKSP